MSDDLPLALRCIATECLDGTTPTAEGDRVRQAADEIESLRAAVRVKDADFQRVHAHREQLRAAMERARSKVNDIGVFDKEDGKLKYAALAIIAEAIQGPSDSIPDAK